MRLTVIALIIIGYTLPAKLLSQPDSVNCFVEIQDIWDIDFDRGTSMVDFYLTIKYGKPYNIDFYLLNGEINTLDTVINNTDKNYLTVRIVAEIRNSFEFKKYPLDRQEIAIKIEPFLYAQDVILFSEPYQNTYVGEIHLNGWETEQISYKSKITTYRVNEDNKIKGYSYSNAIFVVPIIRDQRFLYAFKIFIPSIISILIIYIGFLITPSNIESRLNLSVGSLFVMISNFIVTQQMLPNVSSITLVEKVNILGLIIVFLTILHFALGFRFKTKLSGNAWKLLKLTFVGLTAMLYFLLIITLAKAGL